MYKNIKIKKDGTFVVDYNGMPFHITEDYPTADMYGIEMTYAEVKKYADSHQDEVTEYEEPVFTLDPEIEKQILIANKEKEKQDLVAYILTDIDVETNKEKLRTIIEEIENFKKTETTKITVSQENNGQLLKGNTKYRITTNTKNIVANGSEVSIKFNLVYIRSDTSKTSNPQEQITLTSIQWLDVGNTSSIASMEFTTSNYIGDNHIHRIYCLNDGLIVGELSEQLEFYLEEVL